ncbi:MAG: phosphate ABC transporter permease subunit PstC [Alphaproteobacteria bacterium]
MLLILILCVLAVLGMGFNQLVKRKIIARNYALTKSARAVNHLDVLFLLWFFLLLTGVLGFVFGKFLFAETNIAPAMIRVLPLLLSGGFMLLGGIGFYLLLHSQWLHHRWRNNQWLAHTISDRLIEAILFIGTLVSLFVSVAIISILLWQSVRFFDITPIFNFLFSTNWNPSGGVDFGALPIFWGSLVIAAIAMMVAVPFGLLAAISLHEYCNKKLAAWLKPILELLAGVPTVVYGFFAILIVSPFIKSFFGLFDLTTSTENALSAGLVMGIAIIPIVSSLSQDALNAVPRELKEASLGLGATKSETMKRVLLPYASGGIFAAILIAISRAVGETMIVVMAASLTANISINPLESLTTATVQIVSLLTGDSSFDSPQTLSAYALGLLLFLVTLVINSLSIKLNNQQKLKGRI